MAAGSLGSSWVTSAVRGFDGFRTTADWLIKAGPADSVTFGPVDCPSSGNWTLIWLICLQSVLPWSWMTLLLQGQLEVVVTVAWSHNFGCTGSFWLKVQRWSSLVSYFPCCLTTRSGWNWFKQVFNRWFISNSAEFQPIVMHRATSCCSKILTNCMFQSLSMIHANTSLVVVLANGWCMEWCRCDVTWQNFFPWTSWIHQKWIVHCCQTWGYATVNKTWEVIILFCLVPVRPQLQYYIWHQHKSMDF